MSPTKKPRKPGPWAVFSHGQGRGKLHPGERADAKKGKGSGWHVSKVGLRRAAEFRHREKSRVSTEFSAEPPAALADCVRVRRIGSAPRKEASKNKFGL
jgi:hypothetical protein